MDCFGREDMAVYVKWVLVWLVGFEFLVAVES